MRNSALRGAIAGICLLSSIGATHAARGAVRPAPKPTRPAPKPAPRGPGIPWAASFQAAMTQAKPANKLVMADFYTDW